MGKHLHSDSLLDALVLFTNRYHRPISFETITAGLPIDPKTSTPELLRHTQSTSTFSRAAKRAGFKTTLIERPLSSISELHLPVILILSDANSCILEAFSDDRMKAKVVYPEGKGLEEWVEIEHLDMVYLGYAFLLKKELDSADEVVTKQFSY